MSEKVIAYDLGTGGIKASLFNKDGLALADSFKQYDTLYSGSNMHEQRCDDWWQGIIDATQLLFEKTGVTPLEIAAVSISGHSLGVVPIDDKGNLLRELTPIWSDTRASNQTKQFFSKTSYENWYLRTGNGFPAECYSVFKMMWYKQNEPQMYAKIDKILGTKDYCNFRLCGAICTDNSYASGSGVYDLMDKAYIDEYIEAAGIQKSILPEIVSSHQVIGEVTKEASKLTGLAQGTKVVCGGVDNSCMALGGKGIEEGRVYTSLGSSSWIALTSYKPILDIKRKPFVFAHVINDMYASATSIFSAGNSFRWVRDNICADFLDAEAQGKDAYTLMNEYAAKAPVGSNKLLFNPSLAGGSMIEHSPNIRGGYIGLSLSHSRADLIRAAMEGIAFNLRYALDVLRTYNDSFSSMLMVGGGSKSDLWMQMFADIYEMQIVRTNIGQNAASLGAAALSAVGIGLWQDYKKIDEIHKVADIKMPNGEDSAKYMKLYPVFKETMSDLAKLGDKLFLLEL